MTLKYIEHYINGHNMESVVERHQGVTHPATGQVTGQAAFASQVDGQITPSFTD